MTLAPINAVIVLQPFGTYSKGQLISDPAIMAAILNGGNATMVIKTQVFQQVTGSGPAAEER